MRRQSAWFIMLTLIGLASTAASSVRAGVAEGSLVVSVRVESGCSIYNAALEFGTYLAGQNTDSVAQTEIIVDNCPVDSLSLSLDGGTSGNVRKRQLVGANGAKLSYQLYQDPQLRLVAGTGKQALTTSLAGGSSATFRIYGVIGGGQSVPPGVYTDTVRVTLDF